MPDQRFLKEENILSLLLGLSIPAIISGLVDSLYNTVDSIFVGQFVGKSALAALSVINVIQLTYISIGVLFSVGNASIISRALGAKNYEHAIRTLKHSFWGTFIFSNIISCIILVNLDSFLKMIGATGEVLPHAKAYGSIILWTGFILPINIMILGAMRAQGQAVEGTKLNVVAAFINIVLDALFIIVFGWGVAGAAVATAIGQSFLFVMGTRKICQLYRTNLMFYHKEEFSLFQIKDIALIGFPTGSRLMLFVIVYSVANAVAGRYGAEYLSAFGVYTRLANLMAMICISLTMGAQPLIGFNYGAMLYDRVHKIIITTLKVTLTVSGTASLILLISPDWLYRIFINNDLVIAICKEIARTEGMTFWLWGSFICIAEALQAMGHAKQSMLLSLTYPVSVLVLLSILPLIIGVSGIWVSFAISYVVIAVASISILIWDMRQLKKKQEALRYAG